MQTFTALFHLTWIAAGLELGVFALDFVYLYISLSLAATTTTKERGLRAYQGARKNGKHMSALSVSIVLILLAFKLYESLEATISKFAEVASSAADSLDILMLFVMLVLILMSVKLADFFMPKMIEEEMPIKEKQALRLLSCILIAVLLFYTMYFKHKTFDRSLLYYMASLMGGFLYFDFSFDDVRSRLKSFENYGFAAMPCIFSIALILEYINANWYKISSSEDYNSLTTLATIQICILFGFLLLKAATKVFIAMLNEKPIFQDDPSEAKDEFNGEDCL